MQRAAIGLLSAALLSGSFAGCGGSTTNPSNGLEGRAAAVVLRLDALVRAGRYDQICDELLTVRARSRAGGAGCPRGMRVRTAGLAGPSISLIGVRATGDEVQARVRVASRSGATADRTVVLAQTGRDLRVDGVAR